MAYFFGKGSPRGFDWGRKPLEGMGEGELLDWFGGMEPRQPPIPAIPGVTSPGISTVTPSPAPGIAGEGVGGYDALLDMLFGKGFETIRGIGERGRESLMYDTLAREGLLGTGAVADIGKEMAWGTERGIADLIRSMAEMRAGEEQEGFF